MSEEGGGGHGGSWIVTYCDMVTLLMACFIMVITFSSKEQEKFSQKKDSMMDGPGGSGLVGAALRAQNRDSVVLRQRPPLSRVSEHGSEMPSMHSDNALEVTTKAVGSLIDMTKPATLSDSYALEIPVETLFRGNQVSPSGAHLLHVIAENVKKLPYDIYLQVSESGDVPRGIAIAKHLFEKEGIFPGRVAIGVRPGRSTKKPFVSFVIARQVSG